jgi:nicotinamidase-related amidase
MLKTDKTVLVIVDVQGRLATLMYNREEFYRNLVKMIKGAKVLGIPIIWNEQLPDKLGETIPEIRDLLTDMAPLVKSHFSCCGNETFVDKLEGLGRRQVLLVGMETHICVYQTARDLLRNDYKVHVVADAVSSRTELNSRVGIEAMKDAGAHVTTVEMALFEMLKIATGDQFKQIVQIVK